MILQWTAWLAWLAGSYFIHTQKETLPELHQALEVTTAQTSALVNLVFSHQTGFIHCSIHLLIQQWLWLSPLYQAHGYNLGLGSKLYPRNIQHMLKKDRTWFKQSLS